MTATEQRHVWFMNSATRGDLVSGFGYEPSDATGRADGHLQNAVHLEGEGYPTRFQGKRLSMFCQIWGQNPPPLFSCSRFFIVTEAMAAVLERFDLGQTTLRKTSIFGEDGVTPAFPDRQFYCLALAESKKTILPEISPSVKERYGQYTLLGIREDDRAFLSPAALDGPDLWKEGPSIINFFVSDRLGEALIDTGWREALGLYRCPIREG